MATTERTVIAHGTFDLLHSGHVSYLEFARKQGDTLLVALSSDEMARIRKGQERPIREFGERKITLEALRYVDGCFEAPYPTDNLITNLLRMLENKQPDVFVTSYQEFQTSHAKFFKDHDIKLVVAPVFGSITTTELINKIVKRYENKELSS